MWLVGSLIGRLLYPQQSQSKPEDLAGLKVSGPTPGSPIAVLWGDRRMRGHVIWAAAPISRGGGKKGGKKGGGGGGKKGGGDNETYVRSFAHAVCLGQAQLRQILINDEVVWDVDDPSIGAEAGVDVTWHEGTQDQDPDARLAAQQAEGGGANNPTHTEQTTLNGAAPTYTVGHLPVVSDSEVVWYIGGGGTLDSIIYMQRVASSPGQDQYTINYATGLLSFGGTYTSLSITIRYQSGSLTGEQEALGYPNVAYAYWHEFETGTTATIPQATYVCTRLFWQPGGDKTCGLVATFTRPTLGLTPEGYYYRPSTSAYSIVDGDRLLWWVGGATNQEVFVSSNRGETWGFVDLGFARTALVRGGVVWDGKYTFSKLVDPSRALWLSTNGLDWTTEALNSPPGVHNIAPVGSDLYGFGSVNTSNVDIFRRTGVGIWVYVGAIPGANRNGHEFIAQIPGQNEVLLAHAEDSYNIKRVTRLALPSCAIVNGVTAYPWPTPVGDTPDTVWPPVGPVTATVYVVTDYAAPAKSIYRTLDGGASWHYTTAPFLASSSGARLASPVRFGNRTYAVIMRILDNKEVHIASIGDDESEWQVECEIGSASGECQFAASGLDASGNLVVYAMLWTPGDPNDTFRVFRFSVSASGFLPLTDVPPPDVVKDIITDDLYGCRVEGLIHQASQLEMREHTVTHDLLVAGVLEQRTTALALIEQVMAHYMGWLAVRQGLFYFGGRRPETVTREIVLDDMLEDGLLTYSLAGPRDTKNKIIVDYTDRSRGYNSFPVSDADDPDRTQNHDRTESITLDWFCAAERAKLMASLLLVLRRLPAMALEAVLGPKEIAMASGDVVAVTVSRLGLFQEPVRILAVGEADREDLRGGFRVAMEREPAGLLEPRTYPIQPPVPSDPPPSPFVPVGPTLAAVWEMPPELAGEDVVRTMFIVAGTHPDWRGAAVYMSLDGGSTYDRVATYMGSGATIGSLTNILPSRIAGWFDRDDAQVDVRASAGILTGTTRDGALAGTTLSLLAGEPVSYRDAVLTASGRYRLRGTLRAWFEQPHVAQGIGNPFAFVGTLPGFSTLDHPHGRIGIPLAFKVVSISASGREQDVAEAVAIPVTLQGIARKPSPVYGLQLYLNGEGQGSRWVIGTGEIDVPVLWRYARRDIPESAQLVHGAGVITKHPEFLGYRIEIRTKATAGGTYGLRRTVDQTGETYTYTAAMNNSDNGVYHPFLRFDVHVRRTVGGIGSRVQTLEVQVIT
jgi:hypothetical protein